ncbi:hypothetical protein CerSpe_239760 [Prunus speciosa]
MSPDLMGRFICFSTAKEIWDAVKKTYFDGGDETFLFDLNKRAFTIKQNGAPVHKYYSQLQTIFQEIDHRTPNRMHCDADVTERQTELDRLRVHLFLAGLDPQFDQVRGEILRKDPKLDLDQTFAYVRREAQQRLTMASTPDTAVLATQRPRGPSPSTGGASQTQTTSSCPETKCTHCGGSKHTRARCYELIRYPDWWDHSKAPRRNKSNSLHTSSVTDPAPAPASASVATSGTQGYVLHSSSKKHTWVIDTGATDHMTFDPGQIISHTPFSQSVVSNANGTPSPVIGEGSLSLSDSLTLDSVLIVPSLHHNLLSVAQITTALNCTVTFWPTHCVFQDILSSNTIGCGTRRGKLYYLDLASDSEASLSQAFKIGGTSVEKKTSEVWLWHRRLGHASFGYLQKLFPSLFSDLESSSFKCDICELAKSHRVPFPLSSNKSLIPFSLVHSDVWGPSKVTTPGGARWFVTFIDDCTRMTWVSRLKTKGEVNSKFQQFYHMVETQFHTRIQVLRSDNGGEFLNHDLNEFFQAHGIIHQCSCPSTPQQNGVVERKNRHLLEVVRASLFGANMPRSFWGEAVLSAAYLINRIPSSILQFRTPLQTLQPHSQIPPTQNLEPRVFGCVVFVHLHDHQRSKLDPRADKCVFIGYAPHQKGYRRYHPPSRKVYTSMDVAFREQESYFSDAQEDSSQNSEFFTSAFFPDSFQTQNDQLPTSSDRSPDENDRSHVSNDRSPHTPTTLPESDRSHASHDRSPRTSQRTETLLESDRSHGPHDRSPRTSQSTTSHEGYRSPDPHDRSPDPVFSEIVPLQSDPSHHTQEERIEEFVPAPENSSAPVPHQSSAEDVI